MAATLLMSIWIKSAILSLAAAVALPPFFLLFPGTTGGVRSFEEALLVWPLLGPPMFLIVFLFLLHKERRSRILDRYPQSEIKEFSTEEGNRLIDLRLEWDNDENVTFVVRVSFRERFSSEIEEGLGFDVNYSLAGFSKIRIRSKGFAKQVARAINRILEQCNPPLVPIKWKPGVLTVTGAGLKYTEGPYALGPIASAGITGNLTIIEGLKGVVDEVEAIWKNSASDNNENGLHQPSDGDRM